MHFLGRILVMPDSNPLIDSFKPARTKRASEVIYEQIYQKIIDGEIKEGDRLPSERELAEVFRRGRPSVREALRMLQQDGFLRIVPGVHGGAFVKSASLSTASESISRLIQTDTIHYEELAEFRICFAKICADLALKHRTEEDMHYLRNTLSDFKKGSRQKEKLSSLDIAYHNAIARASHNQLCILISEAITDLFCQTFWDSVAERSDNEIRKICKEVFDYHQEIINAIEAHDIESLHSLLAKTTSLFAELTHKTQRT